MALLAPLPGPCAWGRPVRPEPHPLHAATARLSPRRSVSPVGSHAGVSAAGLHPEVVYTWVSPWLSAAGADGGRGAEPLGPKWECPQ